MYTLCVQEGTYGSVDFATAATGEARLTTHGGPERKWHTVAARQSTDMLNVLFQAFRRSNPMALPQLVLHVAPRHPATPEDPEAPDGPAAPADPGAHPDVQVEEALEGLAAKLRSGGVPYATLRKSPSDGEGGQGGNPDGRGDPAPGPDADGAPEPAPDDHAGARAWRARMRALHLVQDLARTASERSPSRATRSGAEPPEDTPRPSCLADDHWVAKGQQYGRYAFPRSDLLTVIENAVAKHDGTWNVFDLTAELNGLGWRPNGSRTSARLLDALRDSSQTLPALLIVLVTALVAEWPAHLLVGAVVLLVVLALVLGALLGRAPLLLGRRREIRWFLGTTYLDQGPHADRGEGGPWHLLRLWPPGSVRQRLVAVADDISDSGLLREDGPPSDSLTPQGEAAQRRHLHLRMHALREDLRDAHNVWGLDLRGRKRPTPPVLLLPGADYENGGIELIKALSDIRSIRSELDPLLVVATVRGAHVDDLEHSHRLTTPEGGGGPVAGPMASLPQWYVTWNHERRVNQAPSIGVAHLPWVFRVPVDDGATALPDLRTHRTELRAGRPRWTWLWSLPALVVVLAAGALGAAWEDRKRGDEFCDGDLRGINRDSRWEQVVSTEEERGRKPKREKECVGVATGSVTFAGENSRSVQEFIRDTNEEIAGDRHVTIVYAGPLGGDGDELVKGFQELRGAYAVQRAKVGKSVKLRILVASGGRDMYNQRAMAERVVELSRRDPTIVGVVGMGRNMTDSREVQDMFREASLAVVSGTNSGTKLAEDYPNFFGLAATDQWQSEQLQLVAEQLARRSAPGGGKKSGAARPERPRAVVLARAPASHDQYTRDQKKYATTMLDAAGYDVKVLPDYELPGGSANLDDQTADICGRGDVSRVVYFAGRSEDVGPLMEGLSSPDCEGEPIAILGGDDLSKAGFAQKETHVADNVTLYHPTLTALRPAAEHTDFYERLKGLPAEQRESLRVRPGTTYASPDLSNGQTALTHDATEVLYRAATAGGRPRGKAETWANLRLQKVGGLATGTIDFTAMPFHGTRDGYGITLMKIANPGKGTYDATVVCERMAGNTEPLTEKECDIGE